MSSKLLNPASELYHHKASEKDLAKYLSGEGDTIAAVSKLERKRQGAPKKSWAPKAVSKVMDPGPDAIPHGYAGKAGSR